VFCGAVAVGLWVFFAPMALGGSTTYAVTSGISMEPMLHKNDVALVRSSASYVVGDVVLYQSQVVHRPVLHRIILIQDGKYFFKGDNNDFVDPGYATRADLVGTLWFKVSKVGGVLAWFGTPAHAATLAGLATLLVALVGVTTTNGRRRRRGGSRAMNLPKLRSLHATSQNDARQHSAVAYRRRPSPYFEGPMPSLAALGVSVFLALVLLVVGFTSSRQQTGVLPNAYAEAGKFSYSAKAKAPTPVYPSGSLATGDPIYPSLVDTLSLRFEYLLSTKLPHSITGTIELRALVLSTSDTWQEVSTVVPLTEFVGDNAVITTDFPLAGLYTLIDSVIADTGIAGTNYSVDIQPVVHVVGTVADQSIDETFSPVLPFAVSRTAIRIDAPAASLPSGATTSTAASAGSALTAVLGPTSSHAIPAQVANEISIAKYRVRVSELRVIGIVFALLALVLAVVHDRLRRRLVRRSEEEQIAKQFNALIVPVAALGPTEGRTLVRVPEFANLAGLARFLERPILYEVGDGERTFAVDDDVLRYVTQAIDRRQSRESPHDRENSPGATPVVASPDAATATPSTPVVAAPAATAAISEPHTAAADTRELRKRVSSSSPSPGLSVRALLARGSSGFVVLAVVATLSLSLTASTTVPPSYAGVTFVGGAVSQGAPAGCSSLALTSLVTGSGNFSSSASHALILGDAGANTINSTGQYNCIVAGGGRDRVTAKSTSVCITGPGSGTSYSGCVKRAK
jgi:signal peptidase I